MNEKDKALDLIDTFDGNALHALKCVFQIKREADFNCGYWLAVEREIKNQINKKTKS